VSAIEWSDGFISLVYEILAKIHRVEDDIADILDNGASYIDPQITSKIPKTLNQSNMHDLIYTLEKVRVGCLILIPIKTPNPQWELRV